MKVIDLLNEMVKGTQPKHIKVFKQDWYWNNYDGYVKRESLTTTPDAQCYLFNRYRLDFALDKTVEIIEDTPKEDKKMAKIGKLNQVNDNKQHLNNYILRNKINEIIDRLNGEE